MPLATDRRERSASSKAVEPLQILEDALPRFLPILIVAMTDQLRPHGPEEALSDSIIRALVFSAHVGQDGVLA